MKKHPWRVRVTDDSGRVCFSFNMATKEATFDPNSNAWQCAIPSLREALEALDFFERKTFYAELEKHPTREF